MTNFPTTTESWVVTAPTGGFSALQKETRPVASLSAHEVLVQMKAASLNFRDLAIPNGLYPFPLNLPRIATSDGAGTVLAVGDAVTEFAPGDAVTTLFHQGHQAGPLDAVSIRTGLGGALDGALRQYGVFPATGLVKAPANLSFEEAATLPCAALTAWNALYGGQAPIKAGDSVLVQGSGGVSVFALQFAKAAGAFVIATTSSEEKAKKLTALGADVVLNYKTNPEWGVKAKELSLGGAGVDIVIEVGGETTLPQSYKATKIEGSIALIGFVGGNGDGKGGALDPLANVVTIRGVYVGSKEQMKHMNKCIEVNKLKPVVDEKVFDFANAKDAYQYMWDQKHFGKVVIKI